MNICLKMRKHVEFSDRIGIEQKHSALQVVRVCMAREPPYCILTANGGYDSCLMRTCHCDRSTVNDAQSVLWMMAKHHSLARSKLGLGQYISSKTATSTKSHKKVAILHMDAAVQGYCVV